MKNDIAQMKLQITALRTRVRELEEKIEKHEKIHKEILEETKNLKEKESEDQKKLREFLKDTASCNINILLKHFKEMLEFKKTDEEFPDDNTDS